MSLTFSNYLVAFFSLIHSQKTPKNSHRRMCMLVNVFFLVIHVFSLFFLLFYVRLDFCFVCFYLLCSFVHFVVVVVVVFVHILPNVTVVNDVVDHA